MRNGQNKRMRGRNNNNHAHSHSHSHGHRKSHNPMARVYESNGPEVKIRGNPAHIAEKYMQLARDAQTSGDPVSAENYFQHAEHYFRLIAAAQEQFRQNNPHLARQETEVTTGARDENFDDTDGDDDTQQTQPNAAAGEAPYGTGEQPYLPRDAQPFPHRDQPQPSARPQQAAAEGGGDIDRLPSFITGGQGSPQPSPQGNGQNGHEAQGDRFPLHRRRRRHRGPRPEAGGEARGGDHTPRED